jgi:hypothetical protein
MKTPQAGYNITMLPAPQLAQMLAQSVWQVLVLVRLGQQTALDPQPGELPQERQERLGRAVSLASGLLLPGEQEQLGALAANIATNIGKAALQAVCAQLVFQVEPVEPPRIVLLPQGGPGLN